MARALTQNIKGRRHTVTHNKRITPLVISRQLLVGVAKAGSKFDSQVTLFLLSARYTIPWKKRIKSRFLRTKLKLKLRIQFPCSTPVGRHV